MEKWCDGEEDVIVRVWGGDGVAEGEEGGESLG